MSVKFFFISRALKPKIIHSIQGRMRIHIPALLRIDSNKVGNYKPLLELFSLPEGIEAAEITYISGNILLLYNSKIISEAEVFNWINSLSRIVANVWEKFSNLESSKIPIVANRFKELLNKALKQKIVLEEDLEIPDEIWS